MTAKDYPIEKLSLPDLIDLAGAVHAEIKDREKRLSEIKGRIAEAAVYKGDSKTAHLDGLRYAVTVQKKENVKWDQGKLEELREAAGDGEFFKVFKWTFEPHSKKLLDGALEFGAHRELIKAAMAVTPGSPTFTFKPMESA